MILGEQCNYFCSCHRTIAPVCTNRKGKEKQKEKQTLGLLFDDKKVSYVHLVAADRIFGSIGKWWCIVQVNLPSVMVIL